ncbi:hypothetical protein [Montanilutibacter psychrotolerans]|uniref:Uncharacterized protein n=1 Tax=Montanilutibacter psychrotolerans TaxID=1327343 RepID=A0A3M8T2I7_9GAMM|nr:hypothetical protein [Lysobacter psychrotolerans]RNF85946.1 hypothetical protein EER27_00440 [Lysobacter psychrotolerans]
MSVHAFRLDSHWFQSRVRTAFAPRKPRHRWLRVALGVVGLGLVAVLAVAGLVIGAMMLAIGLAWRLWKRRGQPIARAADPRVVDAQFSVVRPRVLPLPR